MAGRQVRHPDGFLQEWGLRAARHDAGLLAADVHVVAVAADCAFEHLEANQLPRSASAPLTVENIGADELLLLPADDPAEIRLDDRRRFVDVVAVQTHRGLEPQRIARPEPRREDARRLPGGQNRVPRTFGGVGRYEYFEAIFAGVTSARD